MPRNTAYILLMILWMIPNLCPNPVWASETSTGSTPFLSENLNISAWIENGPSFIVTEQVRLVIEVATATWFVKGTKISPLEIEDALLPSSGQLAVNFVRHVQGRPWSIQQWTLLIYPLKAKSYQIPRMTAEVSIADQNGKPVSTVMKTDSIYFSAKIPVQLKGVDNWVAATRMNILERYHSKKDIYDVGDAITRTIEIKAEGLPAMMLPIIKNTPIEGLAVYEDPPALSDKTNRGENTGVRLETSTYVIEKPGSYKIHGRSYVWWNLSSGQLETIELPERIVATQGYDTVSAIPKKQQASAKSRTVRNLIVWGVIMIVFGIVTAFYFLRSRKIRANIKKPLLPASFRKSLKKAVKNHDPYTALQILYQWFDHYGPDNCSHFRHFLREYGTSSEYKNFDDQMTQLYGRKADEADLSAEMKSLSELTRFMKEDKPKWYLTVIGTFVNLFHRKDLLKPGTPLTGKIFNHPSEMINWIGINEPNKIPR